ncbi:MAG: hypothetical protein AB7S26_06290 [Sandaracinaceae bacterium]
MDVQLISCSVLDLPSSHRVDAIVHDGATDLRTWPGPGPDRDLTEHYGPELPSVLERERERLDGGALKLGEMIRLHQGKLHCDFLLWVATRGPEKSGIREPAPDAATLSKAVKDALTFVSERHVAKVAIGPLGAGPGEMDETDRLVLVARAATEYFDDCYKSGRPAGIEEVLVCHPHSSKISVARRSLGRAVKVVEPPRPAPAPTARRSSASSSRSSSRSKGGGRAASKAKRVLSEGEIANARATARAYDRTLKYEEGQFLIHPKFGVGRIDGVTAEGFIVVLFEDGETKRLLHNRP